MANFSKAFKKTMKHEGGYSNDPVDRGGETFRGITRRFSPQWKGWPLVEKLGTNRKKLMASRKLYRLAKAFYKKHYWRPMRGDSIQNQKVAEELFDTAVNTGPGRATKFLQKSLNALNRKGRLFPNLTVDGGCGPKTRRALNKVLRGGDARTLWKMLNVLQGSHYLSFMSKNEAQERFARGWFKRVFE